MKKGEVWFAKTPGGDRPVLVLTRNPVAFCVGTPFVFRDRGPIALKGFDDPVRLFEVPTDRD